MTRIKLKDISHLHKCDKSYVIALKTFIKQFNTAESNEIAIDLFNVFAQQYTVLPELWAARARLDIIDNVDDALKLLCTGFSHFYSPDFYENLTNHQLKGKVYYKRQINRNNPWRFNLPYDGCITPKYLPFFNSYIWPKNTTMERELLQMYVTGSFKMKFTDYTMVSNFIEQRLIYPHDNLENLYKIVMEYSDSPLPKAIQRKYVIALSNTNSHNIENYSEDKYEQWLNVLFENNDEKYAIQTVEMVLSQRYYCKTIWKVYIRVMEKRNFKIMMNIFLRYTKLFIDDVEMLTIYKNKTLNETQINVSKDLPELSSYYFDAAIPTHPTPIKISEYSNTFFNQRFSFPNDMILNLCKKSSPECQHKLMKSCKYFVECFPSRVCHHFFIGDDVRTSTYHQQSVKSSPSNINKFKINNYRIGNGFHCGSGEGFDLLHNIIPKLYQCNARYISIDRQNITLKDLKFLINPNMVEKIVLWVVEIRQDDETLVTIEDLMALVPNAYHISWTQNEDGFNADSFRNMTALNRNVKLSFFEFGGFKVEIPFNDVSEFLEKHLAPEAVFRIFFNGEFGPEVSKEYRQNFRVEIKKLRKLWMSQNKTFSFDIL